MLSPRLLETLRDYWGRARPAGEWMRCATALCVRADSPLRPSRSLGSR